MKDLSEVAAGILAIRIGDDWCIWNKLEVVRSIFWAGDPNKPVYKDDVLLRLSPRASFDSWKEQVKGTSAPWQQYEVDAAARLRMLLIESLGGGAQHQRLDGNEYLRMLRTSINNQAKELQTQFDKLDLEDAVDID